MGMEKLERDYNTVYNIKKVLKNQKEQWSKNC